MVWSIGGVLIESPTHQQLVSSQLRTMRSGVDGARLAPPRSKPDQWGEIHCPFSSVLTYDAHDPTNAAAALRDIEERCKVPAEARASTPLFHDAQRAPRSVVCTYSGVVRESGRVASGAHDTLLICHTPYSSSLTRICHVYAAIGPT